ncbi:uncharacterized protein MYCFIDRAFT_77166 [Pseudocercospora fijiensis CIRAD86]|uniref:Uncharacterized protein n=1 Tax=Pseudocercospora fijiensis (strain CIRAD86) TaxID=383855 RepID=M3BD31_PSEFD|nr:uncharacterized protein MYCFIDRAFT_77166 [Pseudocercospora fijiensis CIRAD86]EME87063.1 hypothetical protein MYCFIDRAFT_77166 [Pseudocercospora fijiensis CIRAD86]
MAAEGSARAASRQDAKPKPSPRLPRLSPAPLFNAALKTNPKSPSSPISILNDYVSRGVAQSTQKDSSVSKTEYDQLKAVVSRAKTVIAGWNSDRLGNVLDLLTLEAQVERVGKVFLAKNKELKELREDIESLKFAASSREQEIHEQAAAANSSIKALQEELASVKGENASLQTIDRQTEEAAEQVREHQSIVDDLKEDRASLIEQYQEQHHQASEKIDELEDERAALQEEASNLREEHYASLKESGDTIGNLQQEILALETSNSTLEENLMQAQSAVEDLALSAEEFEQTVKHLEQERNNQAKHWQTVLENAEAQNRRLLQELELAESLLEKSREETVAAIEGSKEKETAASHRLREVEDGRVHSSALAFALGVVMGFIALFGVFYCRDLEEEI